MKYKFFLLIISTALTGQLCLGQAILQDPVSARTFNSDKYTDVKGTPFLYDKWIKGNVKVKQGTYQGLELKLDLYENTLFFNRNDNSYAFEEDVMDFVLMPKPNDSSTYQYFTKGLSASSLKPQQYVQVLARGKLGFYRSDIKNMSDMNEINRGRVKTFTTSVRYFVEESGTLKMIKLTKDEILSFMKDKEAEVNSYINEHKLSFKKEADIAAIFSYYNTL